MSMKWLTVFQFCQIMLAYGIVTLLIPYLVLHKKFQRFSVAEQLTAYVFIGNLYVIYLVYLLEFLHVSNRLTLVCGSTVPFLSVWIWKRRKQIPVKIEQGLKLLELLLGGEMGKKTYLIQLRRRIYQKYLKGKRKKYQSILLELVLLCVLVAGITYVYGPTMIAEYGYKASDIPVHNYWINELERNNIWVAGVYPYGFHIIIYYLHIVFGIKTYILLRLFGIVQTYFVYFALLAALKMVCRNRFIPYIGAGCYLLDVFNRNTYARFASALPQEYSMIFVLTSVCMAIRFFQEFARVQKTEGEEKQQLEKNCKWYLIQFAIGFSLTLTIHFYSTMIAGLFCIGVAAGFLPRFVKWNYFRRIMVTGILSVLLSVLPMAGGVALGKGLQGSLYWGLSVITGDKKTETDASSTSLESTGTEEDKSSSIAETDDTSKMDNTSSESDSSPTISAEEVIQKYKEQEKKKQEPPKPLSERIIDKYHAMRDSIRSNVMNVRPHTVEMMFASIVVAFVLGMILLIRKQNDYAGAVISLAVYMSSLCMLQCAGLLHLPALMDPNRCSIFFSYSLCMVWGIEVDAAWSLLAGWWKQQGKANIASLLVVILFTGTVISQGMIRKPIEVGALEDNGAITCVTNIMRENKDFTWTICSANDELRMTEFYGYHYETITFLEELRDLKKNSEILIPTQYVYFFIEKIPLNYAGGNTNHEEVTEEGAAEPLPFNSGLNAYITENRWITMCHMYYWAQAFKELYPDEMEVYYESDSFICYRLQQNVNSPYNLAIDYGYNNPQPKEDN